MDYTVHGILQARILEWVAIPFSRGSSQPRDWTQVTCIAGGFFTSWATREAHTRYKATKSTAFFFFLMPWLLIILFFLLLFFKFYFIFKLYNIVLVLPNRSMYCSDWTGSSTILQTYVSTPVDMPATHSQIHNHNNNLHSLNTFSC